MERTGPRLPEDMEALSRQAKALRVALERSEENTEGMVAALSSFDRRVSAIEASIRPVQVRRQATTMAHENIDRAIENAEAILAQIDIVRRAEAVILRGPHEDLQSFLEAVDLLKGVVLFFSSNKNFKCCEGVLNQVNNLLTKSALKIEEEFRQLMGAYSKPIEPDRLFDCIPKPLLASKGDSEAVGEQPSAIYRNPTLIPSGILPLLHDIASQLVQDGNRQSCYRIYRDARGSALELSLQKLGIEKLSKVDIQRMQWVALKVNIETWTQIMQKHFATSDVRVVGGIPRRVTVAAGCHCFAAGPIENACGQPLVSLYAYRKPFISAGEVGGPGSVSGAGPTNEPSHRT
ncbi:unnamed protein product [Urochloa humidicola]